MQFIESYKAQLKELFLKNAAKSSLPFASDMARSLGVFASAGRRPKKKSICRLIKEISLEANRRTRAIRRFGRSPIEFRELPLTVKPLHFARIPRRFVLDGSFGGASIWRCCRTQYPLGTFTLAKPHGDWCREIPLTVKSKTTDIWRELAPRHESNKGGHNPVHCVQSCGLRSRFVDIQPTGELTVSSVEPADLCRAGEQLVMQALIRCARILLNKPEIIAYRKM